MARRRRIIDLSVPLQNESFEPRPPHIIYRDHREGARRNARSFGVTVEEVGHGVGNALEEVTSDTHSGTHLDAPYHYGPTCEGKPARTIDEVPLEACIGDGVVLDLTHKRAGELIGPDDLVSAVERIEYVIKPADIVLLHTGAIRNWGDPAFTRSHPGLTRPSVLWLLDQGVRVIGIDAQSLDAPRHVMVERQRQEGHGIYEAHWVGREREYFMVEKLANLEQIPRPYGFTVAVFPIKIERASGAWCRAVAILEEDDDA